MSRRPRAPLSLLLALLVAACAASVVVPVFLIRPFVSQTPGGVALSYVLRTWAPLLCVAGLLAGLVVAALLWGRLRWWGRIPVVLAVALLAGTVWLSRFNIYEKMFNPVQRPAFAPVAEASHMKDDDLVLGIRAGGAARAYPVRALAYHHLVNDELAGEPVVATY